MAGKERFADFQRPAFDKAAEIFAAVGYTSWGKVKTIQKQPVTLFWQTCVKRKTDARWKT